MTYYILGPSDTLDNLSEDNELGSVDLTNQFWPGTGYKILKKLISDDTLSEVLNYVTIYNDKKTKYTVQEFLDLISKYKFKR